jgi:hypothetical protein
MISDSSASTSTGVEDDFEKEELSVQKWDLRQAKPDRIAFDKNSPREGLRSLAIHVDGGLRQDFVDEEDEEGSILRYSLIEPSGFGRTGKPCFDNLKITERPIHRNEIRVADPLQRLFGEEHIYTFSFRLEGDIPSCGSTRWVIGQWKQTNRYIPFLAQRFDNGVFHVTVQDEHCSCRVTKAPGDPDRLTDLKEPLI